MPNQVFDVLLPFLAESELKVLLYVARQTLGFDRLEAPIPLDPFPGGSTTSTEHLEKACGVLDRGLLIEGLRSLLQKGLVEARNGPPGVDGNPIIMYSLRFKADSPGSGPGALTVRPSVPKHVTSHSTKSPGRAPGEARDTDQPENVPRVVGRLVEFGLSCQAAQEVAERFPATYILEKLSQVKAMVEAGSPLVSRNPQGYLRRAIEEDYTSPGRFGAAEAKVGCLAKTPGWNTEKGHRRKAKRALLPVGELVQIWQRALAFLRLKVSRANYEVWLQDTVLLHVDEAETLVGCPTVLQRDWLEDRMRSLVRRALAEVLGHDVEVAFIVVDSGGDTSEAA